ncbi:hypothetical protein FRC06_009235, partial [Ceratobasidium sp. 370]
MSQMLAAIANNQPVASPSPDTLDPPPFSPSRTAVVVNMLWLLSLSLSVAVSLVAMLSKEWCFKFMSGRSGPSYDQARKRQRKWNGMERWKMKKALIYLSAMMHLALPLLLLFKWLLPWLLVPPLYAYSHVVKPAIPMIRVVSTAVRAIVDFGDKADDRYGDVIMDTVTSQMLAWLIATCEDSRSVDTALQAIAGAHSDLPHGPLVECGTLDLVRPRLEACLKSHDNPSTVLRYYLTYGVLMSGGAFRAKMDRWYRYYAITDNQFVYMDNDDRWRSYLAYANAHASVVIVTMPFCHWKDTYRLEASRQREVVKMANLILRQHLQPGQGVLSAITLFRLVESTAHYLVGVWPREEILPILLARIFLAYHDTIPDVARGAAVTLAATAFATRSYPGGEVSSNTVEAREQRAVRVLKYYQAHNPDKDTTLVLFVFGFLGILPELRLGDEDTQVVPLPSHFNGIMQRIPRLGFNAQEIFTLPQHHSLREALLVPALRSLSSVAAGEPSPDQAATVINCLPLLIRPRHPDPKVYVLALMALFHANCVELRDLCLNIIDAQPIPGNPMHLLWSPEDRNLLERLCRTLVETNTPIVPIAALHFELLIASIITYSSWSQPDRGRSEIDRGQSEIDRGQSALKSLLNFRNRFPSLRDPSPLNRADPFPRLKSETEGSRQGSMLRAMQSIVDF